MKNYYQEKEIRINQKVALIISVLLLNVTFIVGKTNSNATSFTVSGNILQDTTWASDTVYVEDKLIIAANATLTIEPDVHVIVSHQAPIVVNGAISAIGTSDAYIEFTAADTAGFWEYDEQTGGWGGFEYLPRSTKSLPSIYKYCRFSYAKAYYIDGNDEAGKGGAFYIPDSNDVSFENCIFENNLANHSGGAIYSYGIDFKIDDCTFNKNYAYRWNGGAIYHKNMLKTDINKCRFNGNIAAKGGAIYILDTDTVLVDSCDFQYNEAKSLRTSSTDNLGAALRMHRYLKSFTPFYCSFTNSVVQHSRSERGGLSFAKNTTALIANNNISYNWSYNNGAAIDNDEDVHLTVVSNIFTNNEANLGAVLYAKKINGMELVNNLFANNYGEDDYGSSTGTGGGAVVVGDGGTPVLIANNTFVNNRHNYMGGALNLSFCSNTNVVNNIFYNNSAPHAPQLVVNMKGSEDTLKYSPKMTHNLFQDGLDSLGFYTDYVKTEYFENYPGIFLNNLDTDPKFVQMAAGIGPDFDGQDADWSLTSGSFCINAGSDSLTLDSLGTPVDIAGNPRIFLEGDVHIIDMGCYEFQGNPTAISDIFLNLPAIFHLKQNYPNPFNPSTKIEYNISEQGEVELSIYNMLGQKIKTLVNETQNAGVYSVQMDGSELASGMYIYRLKAGEQVQSRRMLLVR